MVDAGLVFVDEGLGVPHGVQHVSAQPQQPDQHLIDLRIDRGVTIPGGRLAPFMDIYNITNANAEQNITVSSGANFLRPINIIPPRILRIGVRFDW